MKARTADRVGAILSLILLTILVAGSYWLVERMQRSLGSGQAGPPRHEPDVLIDEVVLVRTGPDGRPMDVLTASSMLRYADDGSGVFVKPTVQSVRTGRPETRARAEQATMLGDQSRLDLSGAVHFEQAASPGRAGLRLSTEALTLLPDTDVAQTDRPVVLEQGQRTLTGTGMKLDNLARTFELMQQVRATLPAPQP